MSLWIDTPELFNLSTQQSLLRFIDPHWSLDAAQWLSDTVVTIQLRKYPGNHSPSVFAVSLDCATRTAIVTGATPTDFTSLEPTLERLSTAPRPDSNQ